ncbi:hypothetical protein IP81_16730, partial [Novosphingobium sp. AAP83]|uniref:calcium-binding protein n=1 Tax=Novosphingobium sp. AAP83 TaxID=1523425 RepID=UPI0006CCFB58
AATSLNALDTATTGAIDAASVTKLTGSSSELATSYASGGVTGLGDEVVLLTGTAATAIELNAINAANTGTVDMSTVLTVTGSAADLITTYFGAGLRGRGNEALTLTDTSVAASSLNSLDTRTTGIIDASSVSVLTGGSAQVSAAFASAGISGLGNAAIDVTGSSGIDTIAGSTWNDIIDGAGGADILTGGLGSDTFVFVAGQANGDVVLDYSGVSGQQDELVFEGYGASATFTDLGDGLYEIANASRTIVDVITVNNYSSGLLVDIII